MKVKVFFGIVILSFAVSNLFSQDIEEEIANATSLSRYYYQQENYGESVKYYKILIITVEKYVDLTILQNKQAFQETLEEYYSVLYIIAGRMVTYQTYELNGITVDQILTEFRSRYFSSWLQGDYIPSVYNIGGNRPIGNILTISKLQAIPKNNSSNSTNTNRVKPIFEFMGISSTSDIMATFYYFDSIEDANEAIQIMKTYIQNNIKNGNIIGLELFENTGGSSSFYSKYIIVLSQFGPYFERNFNIPNRPQSDSFGTRSMENFRLYNRIINSQIFKK